MLWHCVCKGNTLIKKETTTMTIENAKELQMNIAKEVLALLMMDLPEGLTLSEI